MTQCQRLWHRDTHTRVVMDYTVDIDAIHQWYICEWDTKIASIISWGVLTVNSIALKVPMRSVQRYDTIHVMYFKVL